MLLLAVALLPVSGSLGPSRYSAGLTRGKAAAFGKMWEQGAAIARAKCTKTGRRAVSRAKNLPLAAFDFLPFDKFSKSCQPDLQPSQSISEGYAA
ncbi:hypothetical protein [Gymnodinialimonas hymeniacidonis]|uniref:hypothetical protein n=1 Tax=Gymnodinialimonas hymeniacidonis TaxID=3126508 RepID=UPI0034C640A4